MDEDVLSEVLHDCLEIAERCFVAGTGSISSCSRTELVRSFFFWLSRAVVLLLPLMMLLLQPSV